jgi:ABC-type spermidine/putrescine transport system permease subunit I
MELFQLCDFGELQVGKNRQTLAVVMTEVFQNGYDARFGAAMAIPVLVNELMIRTLWVIKQHFFEKKGWKD